MTTISLTLNNLTPSQAQEVASFINRGFAPQDTKAAEVPVKADATPKTASPKAATPKPAPVAKAAVAPAPVKAATAPTTAEGYTEVKNAITSAVAAGHRKSVTDALAEYDAKSGQDLDSSVYEEFLAKIAVIVGGEVDDLA